MVVPPSYCDFTAIGRSIIYTLRLLVFPSKKLSLLSMFKDFKVGTFWSIFASLKNVPRHSIGQKPRRLIVVIFGATQCIITPKLLPKSQICVFIFWWFNAATLWYTNNFYCTSVHNSPAISTSGQPLPNNSFHQDHGIPLAIKHFVSLSLTCVTSRFWFVEQPLPFHLATLLRLAPPAT